VVRLTIKLLKREEKRVRPDSNGIIRRLQVVMASESKGLVEASSYKTSLRGVSA